ncbi:MAG: CTP synthetase [Paracoccaceae bacterium]
MTRLMMLIFTIAGASLAGAGVVVALSTGYYTLRPILIAAATGFALALPVSWVIARRLAG